MLASERDPPARLAAVRRCNDAAGRALELALAEALRRSDQEITPESLLVGLAGAEHTLAQRILREHGLDADQLRAEIDRDSAP
ncbi:MAG: Clp protease N-terminal domain-containing protein [Actinomycetota bacterium]|nr:Clp protease N-terminal domain-containing protein [Actinomycetota bacterium]